MTDKVDVVESFPSVLKGFSDEQLDAVKTRVMSLLQTDKDVNRLCSVLINSKRLYALARLALQRNLAAEGISWASGDEEFIIKAMSNRSEVPFTRTEVFDALKSQVMSFMLDEIQAEAEADKAASMDYTARHNDVVASRKVAITCAGKELTLDVGQCAIVFAKEYAPVDITGVSFAEQSVPKNAEIALELLRKTPRKLVLASPSFKNNETQDALLLKFSDWSPDLCSLKRLENCLVDEAEGCELVVIADILPACASKLVEGFSLTTFKDAMSVLARWTKLAKIATLVFVPGVSDEQREQMTAVLDERITVLVQ